MRLFQTQCTRNWSNSERVWMRVINTDDVRIIINIIYHLNSRDAVHGLYPTVHPRFILIRQVSAPYNAIGFMWLAETCVSCCTERIKMKRRIIPTIL